MRIGTGDDAQGEAYRDMFSKGSFLFTVRMKYVNESTGYLRCVSGWPSYNQAFIKVLSTARNVFPAMVERSHCYNVLKCNLCAMLQIG